jgi:hypothetical protein
MVSDPSASIFPPFLQRDEPPAPRGTVKNGKLTPVYGLGWVREERALYEENPDVSFSSMSDVLLRCWRELDSHNKFPT